MAAIDTLTMLSSSFSEKLNILRKGFSSSYLFSRKTWDNWSQRLRRSRFYRFAYRRGHRDDRAPPLLAFPKLPFLQRNNRYPHGNSRGVVFPWWWNPPGPLPTILIFFRKPGIVHVENYFPDIVEQTAQVCLFRSNFNLCAVNCRENTATEMECFHKDSLIALFPESL